MFKLGHLDADKWMEHIHPATYRLPSPDSSQRIVAGVPHSDPAIFHQLVASLEPPYHLLYVLHTPRSEGESGRYQSPPISKTELEWFLTEFGEFLSLDSRFDLWAHSPAENATVIWDRHNQIFAYGPITRFEQELRSLGFVQGECCIPVPHEHHFHRVLDEQAKRLLNAFAWSRSPLQAADEQ